MTKELKNVADELAQNPTAMCYTSGYSMYPMLRDHKDITVIARLTRELKVNDVPLYRKKGFKQLVLHRIIRIKRDGSHVIRGDNTYRNETDISREDIIGVLQGFYRGGRYIDCDSSRAYYIYVYAMRILYPIRWLWHRALRPALSKIKRFVLNKK